MPQIRESEQKRPQARAGEHKTTIAAEPARFYTDIDRENAYVAESWKR